MATLVDKIEYRINNKKYNKGYLNVNIYGNSSRLLMFFYL